MPGEQEPDGGKDERHGAKLEADGVIRPGGADAEAPARAEQLEEVDEVAAEVVAAVEPLVNTDILPLEEHGQPKDCAEPYPCGQAGHGQDGSSQPSSHPDARRKVPHAYAIRGDVRKGSGQQIQAQQRGEQDDHEVAGEHKAGVGDGGQDCPGE